MKDTICREIILGAQVPNPYEKKERARGKVGCRGNTFKKTTGEPGMGKKGKTSRQDMGGQERGEEVHNAKKREVSRRRCSGVRPKETSLTHFGKAKKHRSE